MLNMKCVAWAVTPMVVLGVAITALADPKTWLEQGPAPTLNGQTEGLVNNPVAGAINAIAASPSDPDLVYVGAVNGGVWKTTTATAANPTWIPLTDLRLPALSINSLAISPVHPDTIFAGTGSTSSLASFGSPGFGVARSTNGGKNWRVLASSTFAGQAINSIVPTRLANGHVVLAATLASTGGVFRSTDNGANFASLVWRVQGYPVAAPAALSAIQPTPADSMPECRISSVPAPALECIEVTTAARHGRSLVTGLLGSTVRYASYYPFIVAVAVIPFTRPLSTRTESSVESSGLRTAD
jgi:hypothetical protein